MIHVQGQIEPTDFNARVRRPGLAFLARNSHRTLNSRDFKDHNYWKHCLESLRSAYGGICAYTASFIAIDAGHSIGTVDHFLPKIKAPHLAYEWSNFRFCNPRVNENKDNHLDVMDPFQIQNGWFVIDFVTFNITPADNLAQYLENSVTDTIKRLKLNDDDRIMQSRVDRIREYVDGDISFDYLRRKYPFIASELQRQGLIENIKHMHSKKT